MFDSLCHYGAGCAKIWSLDLEVRRSNFSNFYSAASFDPWGSNDAAVFVANSSVSAVISESRFEYNPEFEAVVVLGAAPLVVSGSVFLNNTRAILANSGKQVAVDSSLFEGNGLCDGSAITCRGCVLNVTTSHFTWNQGLSKGSIHIDTAQVAVNITSSSFFGNDAAAIRGGSATTASGAAITLYYSHLNLFNSTFTRNSAGYSGGALASWSDNRGTFANQLRVEGCTFTENSAINAGGLYVSDLTVVALISSSFYRNRAARQGAGVLLQLYNLEEGDAYYNQLNATIFDCLFEANEAGYGTGPAFVSDVEPEDPAGGGGLTVTGDWNTVQIFSSRFIGNKVGAPNKRRSEGGAIQLTAFEGRQTIQLIDIFNCTLVGNSVDGPVALGGGLVTWGPLRLVVRASNISQNQATSSTRSYGGGFFIGGMSAEYGDESTAEVTSTTVHSNYALVGGGGVVHDTYASLSGISFVGNTAQFVGGGLATLMNRLQSSTALPSIQIRASSLQFSSNSVLEPPKGSVRNVSCLDRGIGGQPNVAFRCDSACSFTFPSSPQGDLWGPHFGSIMGEAFMLATSATKTPFLYMIPSGGYPATGTLVLPRLALVSNELDSVFVDFPEPMNVLVPLGECDGLLSVATLSQSGMGSRTRCNWDPSFSRLVFKANTMPFPLFVGFETTGVVGSSGRIVSTQNVNVLPPALPVPISARVTALPPVVAPCVDVTLDATASFAPGPFPYTYSWQLVSASQGGFSNVAQATANQLGPRLSLSSSLVPSLATSTDLVFSATLSNVFGLTSSSFANVTTLPTPSPNVFLEGPRDRFHPISLELQLNARVEVPDCLAIQNLSITSQWTQIFGPDLTRTSRSRLTTYFC